MGDRPVDSETTSSDQSPDRPVGERPDAVPTQGSLGDIAPGLFPDDTVPDELVGYRVPSACQIAGITYRQLDYWARTGLVEPSVQAAAGSGSQRLYSFRDILALKIVKRLLDAGISLRNIRTAVEFLAERGTTDLAQTTLISDGTTVYEATSDAEIIDLRSLDRAGLDWEMIEASVRKTNNVLIVEQGAIGTSYGGFLADELQRRVFDYLDQPIARVHGGEASPSISKVLEGAACARPQDIEAGIRAIMADQGLPLA